MTMIDAKRCFIKNSQIIYKELADGPVLIDPYRRVLIRLNAAAQEIWKLLDGKHSLSNIVDELRSIFDIIEEDARNDVSVFLEELIKREMII